MDVILGLLVLAMMALLPIAFNPRKAIGSIAAGATTAKLALVCLFLFVILSLLSLVGK